MRAYDFKTGKRIWETAVADPKLGESVPAAPIAWDGLVFAGNASGDAEGGKGRVYALEIDWCTTVSLQTNQQLRDALPGHTWFGNSARNPLHLFGRQDRGDQSWAGWISAVDADSGVWKLRLKSNYPIEGGVTPTAGGVVMFGDVGGNAENGKKLWGQKIGGGIGGGLLTYVAGGGQKVVVAAGLANVDMPTAVTTSKIVVLGIDSARSTR